MENNLDLAPEDFKNLLDKTTALVVKQLTNSYHQKGYHHFPQPEVEKWFDEPLPKQGMDNETLLNYVEEKVLNTATGNLGPHMYAYVMAGGNQIGIIAEKLAATVNQNVTKWHLAPAMIEIEKRVIQWVSEMIGFGQKVGGVLVSSGSAANFDGLTVARNIFFEKLDIRNQGLFGMKPFTVYCSTETHSCVDKSVQMLGIGAKHLRKIATNPNFTINLSTLEEQIQKDIAEGFQPFCIIANAGTVNTGAVDDLKQMAILAKKYALWLHVDGAYGGVVASLESKKKLYEGIELADSVALDFHKWLYQPFEVGCLLIKDWEVLRRTYFAKASYLDSQFEQGNNRYEFNEHHFLLSRNAKALKVWMSMKSYGVQRIKAMIQKDIDLTDYLENQIKQSDDFVLKSHNVLAIVCFQYSGGLQDPEKIIQLNQALIPALEEDGRVFITSTRLNGELVLRACLINHRKDKASTDFLLQVIREVGASLLSR